MIYTVTLNPSIDYIVRLETLQLGMVNRIQEDFKLPGGKGINVSRILSRLNIDSVALGYLGGFTGQFIKDYLDDEGIQNDFTSVQEDTRINVKVKSDEETEMNGQGPKITLQEQEQFLEKLSPLTSDDVVILSGSKPQSLSQDYYQQLIQILNQKNVSFVIDTTGEELVDALQHKPLVVKPNHHELAEIYGFTADSFDDIIPYGKKLLEEGAKFALVSMADKGALFFDGHSVYHGQAPHQTVKNSVGSGDSMIAGFTGTYMASGDPLEAFRIGLACGSATAFADDLATREEIDTLIPQIKITELKN
ncbi:1-phosphofructokinase [Jeotgalibaca sp. MA1X17-3]|uniref:1-phosphofructokinase n=1 Tax=Jeotgalibaca sp. MA1X17-3 TaxID=2908211 RepID=UPI001F29E666|nr:1-phosphofructokinase [Jeotgalibaca sp. MA1X17-3]UJF15867.1 1-phosphofructokinase [Jeotgalibaca sp. MA1X17-3]